MKIVSWLLAIVCITLLGCATGSTKPPSADVTGTWAGEWYGNVGSGYVKMTLQQSGASVTGNIAMSGGAGTGGASSVTGPVTGTMSGDEVSISYQGGIAHLTVRGNEMSGDSSMHRWKLKRQ